MTTLRMFADTWHQIPARPGTIINLPRGMRRKLARNAGTGMSELAARCFLSESRRSQHQQHEGKKVGA